MIPLHPVGHEPKIYSRHNIDKEVDIITGWVATLKAETKRFIDEVWCDSKASAFYLIELVRPISNADDLAAHMAEYLLENHSGYNAIVVRFKSENLAELWAAWNE